MPMLEKEVSIQAPLDAVWNAWTTEEGLAFLSPESNIELRIGGAYEWFLDGEPDEQGKRGGEGSHVLAFLPQKMIAFSWTFPPDVPELRNADERTQVVVLFNEGSDGLVHVKLHAHGWQDEEPWERGWAYFDSAWGYVLKAMKQHLESR
ncbi:MAG: SRPBCC domain-containing protein [Gammaproteobacteria bacterium]|nr:SRPBCC domain-containing protein [Gammaproteobacteria bacterium]